MRKNKNSRQAPQKNRKFFWIFLIFCAAVVGSMTFLMAQQDLNRSKKRIEDTNMEHEIAERIKREAEEKENKTTETEEKSVEKTEEETKKPVQFEKAGPAPKNIVGFVNFKDFVDDQLNIIVAIRQRLQTEGTCTLDMNSMNGKQIDSIVVKTGNDPSTSHCQTFKIPKDKLSAGKWKINIKIVAGEETGTIEDEVIL